ncbi:MAG: glycoside hydrolase family 71/99-like protein [Planctomycetota bacterium]
MLRDLNLLHLTIPLAIVMASTGLCDEPAQVDASTLTGKLMVGYQGWFNCEGDGSGLGWKHWSRNRKRPLGPGNVTVDLWPDVSELDEDERFATNFKLADGSIAEVFSSANPKTVARHFDWMKNYEISGAFLQRFAAGLKSDARRKNNDVVLNNVRKAAAASGRVYAVMYDLSGLRAGEVSIVQDDWKRLRETTKVTEDAAYLHHRGKPLVAVWGIGFNDNRQYSLEECANLVSFLKSNGCSIMLGIPSFWREGKRDSVADEKLHEIIKQADVISPWSVGRYGSVDGAKQHGKRVWQPDKKWCDEGEIDFLPVVFPGFSWHNLKGKSPNEIPRRGGKFFWSQIEATQEAGCEMIYVAMFDEVDEGTAIFKCTNDPPVGDDVQFITYEGLPSDHYLKMAKRAAKLLRAGSSALQPNGK